MYPTFAPKTAAFAAKIASVGFFSTTSTALPGNAVEVVEKKSTEAIFAANAAVLGAKVGYTIS